MGGRAERRRRLIVEPVDPDRVLLDLLALVGKQIRPLIAVHEQPVALIHHQPQQRALAPARLVARSHAAAFQQRRCDQPRPRRGYSQPRLRIVTGMDNAPVPGHRPCGNVLTGQVQGVAPGGQPLAKVARMSGVATPSALSPLRAQASEPVLALSAGSACRIRTCLVRRASRGIKGAAVRSRIAPRHRPAP